MIRTDNLGNFFALASEQLTRVVDHQHECRDRVLADLVPIDRHPTAPSRVDRLLDLIPRERRLVTAAAVAWAGNTHEDMIVHWSEVSPAFDEDCESLARMVDNVAITAPADAPCRTWPFRAIRRHAEYERLTAELVHGRFVAVLDSYTDGFVASVRRHIPGFGNWVRLSPAAENGLGWVVGDGCGPVGRHVGQQVIQKIQDEQVQHWPPPDLVDPWTVDSIVAWAEVCAQYVDRRRRL